MTDTKGFLTTHVLDTARGMPAAGLKIDLYTFTDGNRQHTHSMTTNSDGRTDSPILPEGEFRIGVYELVFHAGAYLDSVGPASDAPRFLDMIPIRFGINDATSHYHVPLLLSAHGYATYRGS